MNIPHSATSFKFDIRRVTSTTAEDESQHLVPAIHFLRRSRIWGSLEDMRFATLPRRKTSPDTASAMVGRKAPPPPPPRRVQTGSLPPRSIPPASPMAASFYKLCAECIEFE
ncbi:hypothetical protein V8B97DRAFT_2010312 [Scleroderma yunnanense]